jgi:phospholipid-binding lipoprotein MlaA
MNMRASIVVLLALWLLCFSAQTEAAPRASSRTSTNLDHDPGRDVIAQVSQENQPPSASEDEVAFKTIADPLEPINRAMFQVNDRLYFWVLKPVASGYGKAIPTAGRVGVRNFFSNMATPIRVANCLLQFKIKAAGSETARFFINTIFSIGFVDIARKDFNLRKHEEDFGQTLGFYGIGPLFFINWPLLGPSSVRDSVGSFADGFLDPWNYALTSFPANAAVKAYDRVNAVSLAVGEYEALKRASLDPYVAFRDAYDQFRQSKIAE